MHQLVLSKIQISLCKGIRKKHSPLDIKSTSLTSYLLLYPLKNITKVIAETLPKGPVLLHSSRMGVPLSRVPCSKITPIVLFHVPLSEPDIT